MGTIGQIFVEANDVDWISSRAAESAKISITAFSHQLGFLLSHLLERDEVQLDNEESEAAP